MTKGPATQTSPRPPEAAGALSPRDQALLKLTRLMAENTAPEEAAPGLGHLLDVSELVDIRPAAKPLKPARRPARRPAARPERPANRGLGLLGHILQALIVLLVVVWVFLLGVLVGRSRPEEKALAGWLEKAVGWAQPRPAILGPGAKIQPPPDRPLNPVVPATPAPSENPAVPAAPAPSENPAVPAAPAPSENPAEPTAPALTAAEPGPLFAVQITLARDEKEAGQRVAQLEALGFQAYFYNDGRRFYIRAGPFPTRAEAEDNRRRLAELGHKGPYVTKLR